MCLVDVYVHSDADDSDREPILTDVAHIEVQGDQIAFHKLFEEPQIIQGDLLSVDLTGNTVFIDSPTIAEGDDNQTTETGASSVTS